MSSREIEWRRTGGNTHQVTITEMGRSPAQQVWDEATRLAESTEDKGPLWRLQQPARTGQHNQITPSDELPWDAPRSVHSEIERAKRQTRTRHSETD